MVENTIQLGTETPQFAEHTLFVETNRSKTRLFMGHGHQVDVLSEIDPDRSYSYSDNEGKSFNGKSESYGVSSTTEDNHLIEHNNKVHINEVIDKIKYLDGENKFTKLELFITQEFKKLFEEKLPKPILEKSNIHMGNYGHSTVHDLIKKHRS